jgi:hypothetical protein
MLHGPGVRLYKVYLSFCSQDIIKFLPALNSLMISLCSFLNGKSVARCAGDWKMKYFLYFFLIDNK